MPRHAARPAPGGTIHPAALMVQTLADVLGVRMTVLPSGSSASGAARLALSTLGHPRGPPQTPTT
jgi:sugar (pentulose or hexulose) kinase